MLQVARLAPSLLGDSRELVVQFLRRRVNADGGFQNRAGVSDIYYTVFGVEALSALRVEPPTATVDYLRRVDAAESLDFVHTTCLARAWAATVPDGAPAELSRRLVDRIQAFRTPDGGFGTTVEAAHGSVYACFLATGALEDLRIDDIPVSEILRCIEGLRASDGGYANHPKSAEGSTPATAAAVVLLRHLEGQPDPLLAEWLLARHHRDGGFFAAPRAPMPDLLSTATALHALTAMHIDLRVVKESTLDFVDTLWTNEGGFCGSWADGVQDCEYTYYGLLALGHLSL